MIAELRSWWRWKLAYRLRYRARRVLSVRERFWPWSELELLRRVADNQRREIASCHHVIGIANKTIAEFQHRLYEHGDRSALDQRDPRQWDKRPPAQVAVLKVADHLNQWLQGPRDTSPLAAMRDARRRLQRIARQWAS